MILGNRLKKEKQILEKDCSPSKFIMSVGSDTRFEGFVKTNVESVYGERYFEIELVLPTNYPHKPPRVNFKTKIYHPNIHLSTGEVCLDILKNNWKPMITLNSVIDALLNLLDNPNCDSPLNCDAGMLISLFT